MILSIQMISSSRPWHCNLKRIQIIFHHHLMLMKMISPTRLFLKMVRLLRVGRSGKVIPIYSKVMRKLWIIFQSPLRRGPTLFFMMQGLLAVGVMEKFFQKVVMTQEKCWIIFLIKALRGRALNVLEEILKLSESTKW